MPEIGTVGQEKLLNAKVLVVGAGGLGCPALQYLAAAGIGTLGIIDNDVVELTNLQRQILFGESDLGKNKSEAAKARLQDLNSEITINAYPERLNPANVPSLFEAYDIILDGSDNFETRYLVNDAAVITNKPVVYGAIFKFEGQISVFNYQNGPTYRCLFPHPPKSADIPNCNEIGVLGILPGIIGTMQANEVLKIALEGPDVISGRLYCFNAMTSQSYDIKIRPNREQIKTILENGLKADNPDYRSSSCFSDSLEVSFEEATNMSGVTFVDVREPHELPKLQVENLIHVPLGQIKSEADKFRTPEPKVFFCQVGIRSLSAVKLLAGLGINHCYSLNGGILALIKDKSFTK